jgi:AcrR family transcriptional regulator
MARSARRQYNSVRRREQAGETRLRIIRSAHDLFVDQGYGRTTIAQIARTAGVAVETVYATFGSKPKLLHEVWDVTVGGDEEDVPVHERAEVLAVRAEADLARRLRSLAVFNTAVSRRTAPIMVALRGAAASDGAAAAMLTEIDRQRLEAMSVHAREAAATGQLAVTEAECRDILWSTTDGALWHRLVTGRNWADGRYAAFLGDLWVAALVNGTQGGQAGFLSHQPAGHR